MKKQLLFTLALFWCSLLSFGQIFSDNNINYSITSPTTVKIISANSSVVEHIIPSTVNYNSTNYLVTSIGDNAFAENIYLTSITLPNSIISIQTQAFAGCNGLTSIQLPNSLISIEDYAFINCENLASLVLPNSVTTIGISAFSECINLSSLVLSSSLTTINVGAFGDCRKLTSVIIPNSVTSIGNYAFAYCYDLTSVTIPNSVTSIGEGAFSFCTDLTSITIPNSVTSIGNHAFTDCVSLNSITVNWTSPPLINANVFQGLYSSITLHIPAGTTSIYDAAPVWTNFNTITEICATPTVFNITSSPGDCPWTGDFVYLSGSDIGINYQLKRDGVNVGGLIAGNGSQLSFGQQSVSGTYTVEAINNIGTCNILVNMNGSAIIFSYPASVGGNITGSATICATTTSGILTLENNVGTIEYWESSISPFTAWTTVAGNVTTYSPGVLSETTQFRAYSRSGNCNPNADSAIATITVNASSDNTTTVSNCGSYTWANNGQTYTDSGIYTGTTTNCVTEKLDLTVNTTPLPTRNMSINGTLCNGATIGTLISKFNNSPNVTCYAGPNGGSPLSASQLIAPVNSNVTFYLTQTIAGCESARLAYNAFVNFVTPPNAAPTQNFCAGATIANLVATPGTSGGSPACCLNWFANPSGGTAIPSSTLLTSGVYYVGQLHISGCTLERTMVTVTINSGILSPPIADATQIYAGSATIASLTATGSNLQWYENPTGGTALPSTTALIDGTIYYVSQSDLCGESTRTAVTAKKISEASQTFCDGATVADLVTTPIPGQTVQWFTTAAGTTPVTTSTLLTSAYYVEQVAPSFLSTLTLPINSATESGIAVQQDGRIVFTDSNYGRILRINADGSNLETLLSNPSSYFADLAIQQDGKIIFTDYYASTIKRMNADGTNIETIIGGLQNPTYIAIQSDGKIVFVADLGIYSVNPDGTGVVLLQGGSASFGANITDIVINQNGKILYSIAGGGAIAKMNPDGTDNIIFYQDQTASFYGLSVQNDGKIVAVDTFNGGKIIRLNSDGTNLVTLASNIGGLVYGTAQESNGNILFTSGSNSINRLNKSVTSNRVAVTVNITPSSENVTTITACDSYTWNGTNYSTSGIYTGTNTNCITEKLNLTITPLADNSVTQSGDNLTATETGATYQWVTCETNGSFTPINLATNQSYFVTTIGSYAVEVTKNGCMIRSACIDLTTLNNASFDTNYFSYYPNPVTDILHITYNKNISSVQIFDLTGRMVKSVQPNTQMFDVNLTELSSAMYLVKLTDENNTQTEIKIFKK